MASPSENNNLFIVANFPNGITKNIELKDKPLTIGKAVSCDVTVATESLPDVAATIQKVRGVALLRVQAEEGILVSGEKVYEKILEPKDTIQLPGADLEIRRTPGKKTVTGIKDVPKAPKLVKKGRKMGPLTLVLIIAAVIGVFFATEYLTKRFFVKTQPVEVKKPSDFPEDEWIQKLTKARERYEIGDSLYENADLNDGNLYWAIQEWDAIIDSLGGIKPEPDVYTDAQAILKEANAELKEKIERLKHNAFVAKQIGQTDEYKEILRQMMRMKPDISDKDYNLAKSLLIEAKS